VLLTLLLYIFQSINGDERRGEEGKIIINKKRNIGKETEFLL